MPNLTSHSVGYPEVNTIRKKKTARSTSLTSRKKTDSPYRSKLEAKVAELLPVVEYEAEKLKYTVPASTHTYITDFRLAPRSYIEVKGRLLPSERKKYLLVRECNPDITLRFFFDKSDNKIYKGSPTTYADWCDKNNFEWTDLKLGLPKSWLTDKGNT
jgi:hypothetical protein